MRPFPWIPSSLALAAFACLAGAQLPRPLTMISEQGDAYRPVIATSGDRMLAMWTGGASAVYASRSDGRGAGWFPPVRVDSDTGSHVKDLRLAPNGEAALRLVGDHAYAVWLDLRHGEVDLYFARSLDGGATWQQDVRLDDGFAPGLGEVMYYELDVSADPGGDHLYVFASVSGPGQMERPVLISSHDGGATWSSAVAVSTADSPSFSFGSHFEARTTLEAAGQTVHLAWKDARPGAQDYDVYYRRSTDGGASFGPEIVLDGPGLGDGDVGEYVSLITAGPRVAVAWSEADPAQSGRSVRVTVSQDGGLSFPADEQIGSYDASTTIATHPILRASGPNLVANWVDDRATAFEPAVYTAVSSNGGLDWTKEWAVTNQGFDYHHSCSFMGGEEGDLGLLIVRREPGIAHTILSSFSSDHGETWSYPHVELAPSGYEYVLTAPMGVYNAYYRNFAAVWVGPGSSGHQVFTSGYRPQTVFASGFTPGSTEVGFPLVDFTPGALVLVGLSSSLGGMALPADGRKTGLLFDSVLEMTIGDPRFMTVVDGAGAGTVGPISIAALPSGIQFFGAGVVFDPAGKTFGDLTDPFFVITP